jgi:hypothetical protein
LRLWAMGQNAPLVSDDPLSVVMPLHLRILHGPCSVCVVLQLHRKYRL